MKPIPVCYILAYYIPDYVRTRTIVSALSRMDGVEVLQARNSTRGPWRYFQTLWRLIRIRVTRKPRIYILGFRGHELYWPVRLITAGSKLILDHMMSPYASLVYERRVLREGSLPARLAYFYEKSLLMSANLILTDTPVHREYLQALFELPPDRILALPVGADEELFHPNANVDEAAKHARFEVLFYGSFLPLHGVDVILGAASILRDEPIHFTLIGGQQANLREFSENVRRLDLHNLTHTKWVEMESLPSLIAQADIGLGGPFGNTAQAHRVVTGKTLQFLAMGKAVIVGEGDSSFGFEDKVNCLVVPQGDAKALAERISWAFHHRTELREIGRGGYELYRARYSVEHVASALRGALSDEVLST
jgi:glycosyltransferase involved in cell wall biosynthesis